MTTLTIVASLAAAACFGPAASVAARRLPPRHATWVITAGAVASALSAVVVLAMLAVALVGQLPPLAHEGRWSGAVLRHRELTEPGVGAAATVAVFSMVVSLAIAATRQLQTLRTAQRATRAASTGGALVVLRDGPADAVAVPGRPGRIVIGESLFHTLTAPERRALVAHEQAHLRHRHHWHRAAVFLAAAANPLLLPLRAEIVQATERWADEDAATAVGDRRRVAETLARAALIARRPAAATPPAAAAHAVPYRVASLLGRPAPARPLLTAAILTAPVAAALTAAIVWKDTEHLFEIAVRLYRGGAAG
jgi:Zn-dependent protease with chaperone function